MTSQNFSILFLPPIKISGYASAPVPIRLELETPSLSSAIKSESGGATMGRKGKLILVTLHFRVFKSSMYLFF